VSEKPFFEYRGGEVFIGQRVVNEAARRIIDHAEDRMKVGLMPVEEAMARVKAINLEIMGGPCPKCTKPFAQVDIDLPDGKYIYYQPDCQCFHKCESVFRRMADNTMQPTSGCGVWKIAEGLCHSNHCFACMPKPDELSDKPVVKQDIVKRRKA
jgi:hypothetical protein